MARQPDDTVCFHAKQCVEKAIKAVLAFHAVPFPRTHDLLLLMRLAPDGTDWDITPDEIAPLTSYSVETRYPGDWEPFTRPEAQAATAVARRVLDAAAAHLPSDY